MTKDEMIALIDSLECEDRHLNDLEWEREQAIIDSLIAENEERVKDDN